MERNLKNSERIVFNFENGEARIEKLTLDEMKETMLNRLKEHNNSFTNPEEITTRLYFEFDGKQEYVEDYSYFTNAKYMSSDLRNALSNGQTITGSLKNELNFYIIEKVYNHDIHEIESENKFMDTFINMNETIKKLEKEVAELKNGKQKEQDEKDIERAMGYPTAVEDVIKEQWDKVRELCKDVDKEHTYTININVDNLDGSKVLASEILNELKQGFKLRGYK